MLEFPTDLPPRSDSLPNVTTAADTAAGTLNILDKPHQRELDDARTTFESADAPAHEVRGALGKMISRVEELVSIHALS